MLMENKYKKEQLDFEISQEIIDSILDYLINELGVSGMDLTVIRGWLDMFLGYNIRTYSELKYPDGTFENQSIDSVFLPIQEALNFLKVPYDRSFITEYTYTVNYFKSGGQ